MSNVSAANQHTPDDRQQKCWDLYVKSIIAGVPNARKAALQAGYSEFQADNITLQGWFKGRKEKLKRKDMLSKAEKVLAKTLEYEPMNDKGEIDVPLLRVQTDVSKHVTSTLGKSEGYSTRIEKTGFGGKPLECINIIFKNNKKEENDK